mmetsp:Transcript_21450/g.40055  ORF Transcript_21450/g.40055 Transcript_21450/m.40055 type:complete len:80 (-) Transcript_21450:848-1087(-)
MPWLRPRKVSTTLQYPQHLWVGGTATILYPRDLQENRISDVAFFGTREFFTGAVTSDGQFGSSYSAVLKIMLQYQSPNF